MRILTHTLLVLIALGTSCSPTAQRQYLFALRSTDELRPDAAITFLGVKVGHLTDLRLSSDGQSIIATGRITEPNMRLLQGDTAHVVLPALLADPQIEIIRGSAPGGEMPIGSTINVSSLPTKTLSPEQHKAVAEVVGSLIQVLTNVTQQSTNSK